MFYTRVDPYYDWIQQTIEKERPTPVGQDMAQPQPTPDMATDPGNPDNIDLAPVDTQPPAGQGGCKCDVGGARGGSAPGAALLPGGLLLLRLRPRRRAR